MNHPTRLRQMLPTVLVAVVAAVLVTLLAPPAVQAATRTYVTLRDPGNNTGTGMAKVVGNKLSVGDGAGPLTVDGTVTAKPAARVPFSASCTKPRTDDDALFESCGVYPPAGKKLVVQSVSATIEAPQRVHPPAWLSYLVNGEEQRFRLVQTYDGTDADSFETYLVNLTGLEIRTDPGSGVVVLIERAGGHDLVLGAQLTVNGYLE